VLFYALVASDCDFAIDLFPTQERADEELREVLYDEPSFVTLLDIVEIDLSGGTE
jgi:hypothetical protein